MKKKLLSIILALCMVLTSLPTVALAEGVFSASTGNSIFVISGDPVIIDPSISIVGFSENITGAKVMIQNKKTGDMLIYVNADGITGTYDSTTGVLTLVGNATPDQYQNALRSIKFSTTSNDTANRSILFSLGGGLYYSGNGHFYEYVSSSGISWDTAKTAAEGRRLYGRQGYLVTLTSAEENAFVAEKVTALGWIGAKDIHYVNTSSVDSLGDWRWVTGPEGLADGGKGTQFYTGYSGDSGVEKSYSNWWSGEPNNTDNTEYVAHIFGPVNTMPDWAKNPTSGQPAALPGQWNDYQPTNAGVQGYVVEYGGMTGDTPINVQTLKTIEISSGSIKAASVTITAPEAGVSPENVTVVETATANADYTVSNVVWNEDLTAGNKFKAGQVYTATIMLTSKNNKEFQAGAFTPVVAGSDSVGTTTTTGTGMGNTVSFTVTFPATAAKVVTGIAVTTQPTDLTYTAGEALDLTGLAATLTYNDGTTEAIVLADFAAKGITTSPANGTAMMVSTHNGNSVTLTCNSKTAETSSLKVKSIYIPIPAPIPPPPPTTVKEILYIDITDGNQSNVLSETKIERTTESDGTKKDVVTYEELKAQDTVDKLMDQGQDTARILIPDTKDEVKELRIDIPQTTLDILSKGKINLDIETENVRISIPKESIQDLSEKTGEDLYFRVVPIKTEKEKEEVENRAKQDGAVLSVTTKNGVSVIGRPMEIETNMSGRNVDIVLPLKNIEIPTDPKEREAYLSSLEIYIEHSDGEKVLKKGEIVDLGNGLLGIKFRINKFSTFTIVKLDKQPAAVENKPAKKVFLVATNLSYTDAYAGEVLAKKLGAQIIKVGAKDKDLQSFIQNVVQNYTINDQIFILGEKLAVNINLENQLKAKGFNSITRLGGVDLYETAKKISEKIAPKKGTPVILVNGSLLRGYSDSISKAAAEKGYAILFVKKNSLTNHTLSALANIAPSKIYIAGTSNHISNSVILELKKKLKINAKSIVRIKSAKDIK